MSHVAPPSFLSDGATFPNLEGNPAFGTTGYAFIGAGDILNLPVSIWILIVVALGAAYVAGSTPSDGISLPLEE